MNFEEDVRKKILQSDFAKNNGRILRTVNILSGKYINVDSICDALEEVMTVGEFDESLVYLHKGCYIEIRNKYNQHIILDMTKETYKDIEVCLTQKGIKLARGFIVDEAVEI